MVVKTLARGRVWLSAGRVAGTVPYGTKLIIRDSIEGLASLIEPLLEKALKPAGIVDGNDVSPRGAAKSGH